MEITASSRLLTRIVTSRVISHYHPNTFEVFSKEFGIELHLYDSDFSVSGNMVIKLNVPTTTSLSSESLATLIRSAADSAIGALPKKLRMHGD